MLKVTKTNRKINSSIILRVMGEISQWDNQNASIETFESYINDQLSKIKQTRFGMMEASCIVKLLKLSDKKTAVYHTKTNGEIKYVLAYVCDCNEKDN